MNKKLITLVVLALFAVSANAKDGKVSIEDMEKSAGTPKIAEINLIKKSASTSTPEKVTKVDAPKIIIAKPEIIKVETTIVDQSADNNPFVGWSDTITSKNKSLSNLSLDEQIISKRLAIKRLEEEIKSVGKPNKSIQSQSFQSQESNLEKSFEQAIKKKTSAKKTVKAKPNAVASIKPSVMPAFEMMSSAQRDITLNSIVKDGDKYYADFTDENGRDISLKTGDNYKGSIVMVMSDKMMLGNKQVNFKSSASSFKNPDSQTYGQEKETGGKPATLFPSSQPNQLPVSFPDNLSAPAPF